MKTIGLIGGLSWESTALYYQHLNRLTRERLGGLHSAPILLWSFDFAQIEALQAEGDWAGATARMVEAGETLARAGAEVLVICSNTMHRMAGAVEAAAGVPLVHIADATAEAVRAEGCMAPLLLATKFTMEGAFYRGHMRERHALDVRVPDDAGRAAVHRIIYEELCRGIVDAGSKARYLELVDSAIEAGADSVILGCTEVTMLIGQDDIGAPVFDSTAIHAEAALAAALKEG
ncbi:aspartate/glutamate racemase family protein [Acuticoccus sp. I52.16.1]|uniref:aspartate/glutamate racemase family protein n=1 Tax=Acuticoccus sp. I52.16.1 TaxID=2928472 RepID=UPI001FD43524|nr:amino acid racemase [Acuticoccus sp. I52.16.1]UOM34584.1 amino acid racemase [Acuticoccus sp. I52.16.1]